LSARFKERWWRHVRPWDVDRAWRWWGEHDPYYAVLTTEAFRHGVVEASRGAFFESGEAHISWLMGRIAERFGVVQHGRALDFGCGVGRLLMPLAGRFAEAVGVDISPGMLREAVRRCREQAVSNAVLLPAEPGWPTRAGSFDLVNSHLVLQHIPKRQGMRTIDCLLGLVRPGGVAALQVPILRTLSWWRECEYVAANFVPMANFIMRWSRKQSLDSPMLATSFDLRKVLCLFERHAFADVLITGQNYGPIASIVFIAKRR
jgi:SAM-dependent methyltransferase